MFLLFLANQCDHNRGKGGRCRWDDYILGGVVPPQDISGLLLLLPWQQESTAQGEEKHRSSTGSHMMSHRNPSAFPLSLFFPPFLVSIAWTVVLLCKLYFPLFCIWRSSYSTSFFVHLQELLVFGLCISWMALIMLRIRGILGCASVVAEVNFRTFLC